MGGPRLGGGEGPTQGLMVTEGAGRRGNPPGSQSINPDSSLLYVGGELASEQKTTSFQADGTRVGRNLPAEGKPQMEHGQECATQRHMCSPALTAGCSTDNLTALIRGFRLITAFGISPGFSPGLSWEFAGEVRGLL